MQFRKIRLTGFKSFVDPTELIIEPGLTGIVGPNGCGKSNLVEAIRWVMGETSAKQMRGGEMNDVIFGGTSNKPARNIAEVGVLMDNSARRAPVGFNEHLELEITRRIERDKGSAYRVNGKEVRARDVQLLFADASTGARSPGLVSQGRIGSIINAKPSDRRMLLEEAAGIIGLHSRRHEAELRLRAAEGNLARLDDVLKTMDAQLQGLKRQGKQASRYRNLSDHIRRAEAILLHLRWQKALAEREAVEARLREAERQVAALTTQVSEATTLAGKTQEALPALRLAEAEAGAQFQHLTIAKTELDAEERRVVEAKAQAEQRLKQLDADAGRESALAKDAAAAIDRLAAEAGGLEDARAGETDALAEAQKRLDSAFADAEEVETALTTLTQAIAGDEARKVQQERQLANLEERIGRLARQAEEIEAQRRRLAAESDIEAEAAQLAAALAAAETALAEARAAVEQAEAGVAAAQSAAAERQTQNARLHQAEREARTLRQQAEQAAGKLRAEIAGLREVLTDKAGEKAPVLGQLAAAPGYEAALGAALGEDLEAALGGAAPRRWEDMPPLADAPALPAGIQPLSAYVTAPPALARRLAQIGVVESAEQALALRDGLKAGQRLVDRQGALWRWDGFTVAAGAPSAAAARLRQKNRLTALEAEMAAAEAERERVTALHADAEKAVQAGQEQERAARAAEQTARQAEQGARQAERGCFSRLSQARDAESRLAQKRAALGSRQAVLVASAERLQAEQVEATQQRDAAKAGLADIPDLAARKEEANAQRALLAEKRSAVVEARSRHDTLKREAETRRQRLAAIADERRSWDSRAGGAAQRIAEIEARRAEEQTAIEGYAKRPAEIAELRDKLVRGIADADARRKEAAKLLAEAESGASEAQRLLRTVEAGLAEAREDRVRAEAAVEQATQARQVLIDRVRERLDCRPDQALAMANVDIAETLPAEAEIEQRLDRLMRERDGMGPVNLRAEHEAGEVEQQIDTMQQERSDLTQAIARLRQGIAALNKEGRERLLASFGKVNASFEELFVRLFGGGRAYLELIESDDPLEAGLQIMASPPGKKLQALSLLSGGEQALTALALIFAVFLTNPSPICVLDEVDAPLDDSNVDRFCLLLEHIAKETGTRFLVVTHHRMTMARMDRLFGVTMAERGISQLVSVDLTGVERLRAIA
ncbi:chromosome segregation protein SMC [Oceanibaculum pacificum]|uniref:Chromosome partition protein Smc n=1 Tax=Oceanibaculum pacificum TaxID=580166 RepID=A0A154WG44_9PROT|nr:chromosome segregation protein SMC [Oceanibaculum pacificum]KZD12494.1 hypothetical protein AUP43_16295 [Oceanibaculum pacificum]